MPGASQTVAVSLQPYANGGFSCGPGTWTFRSGYGHSTGTISPTTTGSGNTSCYRWDTVSVTVTRTDPNDFFEDMDDVIDNVPLCLYSNLTGCSATVTPKIEIVVRPGPMPTPSPTPTPSATASPSCTPVPLSSKTRTHRNTLSTGPGCSSPSPTPTPTPVTLRMETRNGRDTTWKDVTNQTAQAVVGEEVQLRAVSSASESLADHCNWLIPGTTLKSYSENPNTANPSPIQSSDLTTNPVGDPNPVAGQPGFYWLTGGNERVSAACDLNDRPQTVSATFEVEAPTSATLWVTSQGITLFARADWVQMGTSRYFTPPGVQMVGSFQMPSDFGGYIGITQTLRENVSVVPRRGYIPRAAQNTGDAIWLDTCELMTNDYADGETDTRRNLYFAKGMTATFETADQPGDGLPAPRQALRFEDNSRFNDFLLFRPHGFGSSSIWVPLDVAAWTFDPIVDSDLRTWTLDPNSVGTTGRVSGTPTSAPPAWPHLYFERTDCQGPPND